MSYRRIFADFFLILSIFVFPFWVPLVVGTFFVFKFRYFYEYTSVMFFFDLLYGGGVIHIWGMSFILTLSSLVIYFLTEHLRSRLILYTH